jgi:hypothetical protein
LKTNHFVWNTLQWPLGAARLREVLHPAFGHEVRPLPARFLNCQNEDFTGGPPRRPPKDMLTRTWPGWRRLALALPLVSGNSPRCV